MTQTTWNPSNARSNAEMRFCMFEGRLFPLRSAMR